MKRVVVNVITWLFVATVFGMTGCGGGGGQNTTQTPPAISNLQYTPSSSTVNTLVSVNWQFDFTDTGGDISTCTYTVYNPSDVQVGTETINLAIPAGIQKGTQFFTTSNVKFITVGNYTANIFVTDSAGANSNTLTATFTVVP